MYEFIADTGAGWGAVDADCGL